MLTHSVRIHRHGGPEVLTFEEIEIAPPGAGEVLLRQTAIGVNFADTYYRRNQWGEHREGELPAVLGIQGAGIVEEVGPGVQAFRPGDRVAYAGVNGAYAARRLVPAERLLHLPDGFSEELAAAVLLRGMTAEYLLNRLHKVSPGETILWHAAAGGVGLIACQWAKALGAVVIGTVGSDEKAAMARAHGCDHVINYSREDFVARVMAITGGEGVPVVYDSVGRDTFMGSLDCLRPMGLGVNFGTASGQVEPFPLQHLHRKSLSVTRPTMRTWVATRADYVNSANAFFEVVANGTVKVETGPRYPLAETARAHRDLEARRTTHAPVLVP